MLYLMPWEMRVFPFGAEAHGGGITPPDEPHGGGITPFTPPPYCTRLRTYIYVLVGLLNKVTKANMYDTLTLQIFMSNPFLLFH